MKFQADWGRKPLFFLFCFFLLSAFCIAQFQYQTDLLLWIRAKNPQMVMLAYWEKWHMGYMLNKGDSPNQYRLLSFLSAEAIRFESVYWSYLWIRLLSFFFAFGILFSLWKRWFSNLECLASLLLFQCGLLFATDINIQPAEPLNILFFSALYWLAQEKKWKAFFGFLFVASFNKITVVFWAPILFFYWILEAKQNNQKIAWKKVIGFSLAAFAIPVLVRALLVAFLGRKAYHAGFFQWKHNLENGHLILVPLLFYLFFPVFSAQRVWKKLNTLQQASFLMVPFFVAGHFLIGRFVEFRLFVILQIVGAPVVVLFLKELFDKKITNSQKTEGSS